MHSAKSVAQPSKLPEQAGCDNRSAQCNTAPVSHSINDKAIAVLVARPIRRSANLASCMRVPDHKPRKRAFSTAMAGLLATVNQPSADTTVSTVGFDLILAGRVVRKLGEN